MSTRVRNAILDSAFKTTWISSGTTPTSIDYFVYDTNEVLVNTLSGVSSGDGHYYAIPTIVNTPGLYQGAWTAVVSGDSYINKEYIRVYPEQVGQPGRYTNWDDVVEKYNDFADFGGAVKAASHYISTAEAYIDGMLAPCFTVPFSNNNATVRALATDQTFLEASRRSLSEEEFTRINDHIVNTIKSLKDGTMVMVVGSGVLQQVDISGFWSSNEDHHPVFGPHDPLDWLQSSQQQVDLMAARGITIL